MLFLAPQQPSPWLDHKYSNLATQRLRDIAPPSSTPHPTFPRDAALKAVSDTSLPLVVRTAIAFVWDGVFRAGEALYGPGRTSQAPHVPASRFTIKPSRHGGGFTVAFLTRSKCDNAWRVKRWSTDPASAAHNPAHLGSAQFLPLLLASRSPDEHIWTLHGRPLHPADLISALERHLPAGSPRFTGHSFRTSAATSLHNDFRQSESRIAHLGDWVSLATVRHYVKHID